MPGFSDRPFHSHSSQPGERTQRTAGGAGTPPGRDAAPPPEETHYQLLGIQYGAKPAEITRAYREAMKRNHPDRVHAERRAASEELAKRLNHAYAVLSKPASRKRTTNRSGCRASRSRSWAGMSAASLVPDWGSPRSVRPRPAPGKIGLRVARAGAGQAFSDVDDVCGVRERRGGDHRRNPGIQCPGVVGGSGFLESLQIEPPEVRS